MQYVRRASSLPCLGGAVTPFPPTLIRGLNLSFSVPHKLPPLPPHSLTLFVTHFPECARLAAALPGDVAGCCYMDYAVTPPAPAQEGGGAQASPSPSPQQQQAGSAVAADGAGTAAGTAIAIAPAHGVPRVTFLYRARPGVAGASFGLNVARMADLPAATVQRAAAKAAELEAAVRERQRCASLPAP